MPMVARARHRQKLKGPRKKSEVNPAEITTPLPPQILKKMKEDEFKNKVKRAKKTRNRRVGEVASAFVASRKLMPKDGLMANNSQKVTSHSRDIPPNDCEVTADNSGMPSNDYDVKSDERTMTSNCYEVTSNDRDITSNGYEVTTNDRELTSNGYKVTSND